MKIKDNNFLIFLIYILFSLQNSFFDDIFPILGMDLFSLLLTIFLIGYFIYSILYKNLKIDKLMLIFIMLIIYKIIISLIYNYQLKAILIDLRVTLYFFISYSIFKSITINKESIIKIIKIGGLINSIIFLYFMIDLMKQQGIGARNVSINLYISLLCLGVILFLDKKNIRNFKNLLVSTLNVIAIILSQQRTIIIPLIILISIFIVVNFKINLKSFASYVIMIIIIAISIKILDNIGILELVKNRFSKDLFIGENSTLSARGNATKEALLNIKVIDMFFGTGFGNKYNDLELLFSNYLIKYGIIGSVLIVYELLNRIYIVLKSSNIFKKKITFILSIIFIGGVISGLGGNSGQMLLGIIFGIISNRKIKGE